MKQKYKVGDKVSCYLRQGSRGKKLIKGTIKEIRKEFGVLSYVITGGIVDDFSVRNINK